MGRFNTLVTIPLYRIHTLSVTIRWISSKLRWTGSGTRLDLLGVHPIWPWSAPQPSTSQLYSDSWCSARIPHLIPNWRKKQEDNIERLILIGEIRMIKKIHIQKLLQLCSRGLNVVLTQASSELLKSSWILHFMCDAWLCNIWDLQISDTSYCFRGQVHITAVLWLDEQAVI